MRSLDRCPKCHVGRMLTYRTSRIRRTKKAKRYLRCEQCGATGAEIIAAPPRRPRRKSDTSLVTTSAGLAGPSAKIVAIDKRKIPMRLLSIFQVAQLCSIDWQTVRDWIEAGTLPAPILVGGWLRWRETDVEAWIQDGCPPSALRSDVEPLWDALLAELKAADHQAKGN